MRCSKCNAEWTLGNSQEKAISTCPFCGAPLFLKDSIENVVRSLVLMYGKELYLQENELRFKGLLSDFAGRFPKEVKTLKIAIAEHIPATLLDTDGKDDGEKIHATLHCKNMLTEDVGLAENRTIQIMNILVKGLSWDMRSKSEENTEETKDVKTDGSGDVEHFRDNSFYAESGNIPCEQVTEISEEKSINAASEYQKMSIKENDAPVGSNSALVVAGWMAGFIMVLIVFLIGVAVMAQNV